MYLTAHHVRARDGSAGINAYYSRHSQADERRINWNELDIAKVADEISGETVAQSIEIRPGGNSVLSYLDVVAPERTDPGFIADCLRVFEHYVKEDRFPAIMVTPRIGLRFGITIGLQPVAVAEFRRLRDHVLLFLGITNQSKVRRLASVASGPLRVMVTREGNAEIYELTHDSAKRVAAVRPEFSPVRIRISDDTRDDFRALVGDIYPHVVIGLTGLSSTQLGQLGGVEVAQGAQLLWRRSPAGDLPGQILGVWFREHEPVPDAGQAPNGAVLPRRDTRPGADVIYALDLVHVLEVWLPLSEAGVYTYLHSSGMRAGQRWCFVTKPEEGSSPVVFDAKVSGALSLMEVVEAYGADAAERARPDHPTVQLELRRRGAV